VELKAQDYRRKAEEAEERAKTAHDVLAKAWKQVAADYRYLVTRARAAISSMLTRVNPFR
jgi:hypothetical protein